MKAFKYISITLAIIFAVSVTSKQVKAVAGGVVAGGVAAGAAVASIAFFLGSLVAELCDSINETITAYENEAAFEAKLNEQERRRLAAEVTAELDTYMEQVKQQAMEDSYYQLHYQEMTDEERVKYFIDAQLYFSAQQGTLTPAQQVLYATLTAVENQASNIDISDDQSITVKGNVFSELYGEALGLSVRDFLSADVTVTGTGANRQLVFESIQDVVSNITGLADAYPTADGICYVDTITFSNGVVNDKEYYYFCIFSDGVKYAFPTTYSSCVGEEVGQVIGGLSNPYCYYDFYYTIDGDDVVGHLRRNRSSNGERWYQTAVGYYSPLLTPEGEAAKSTYFEDVSAIHTYIYLFDTYEDGYLMYSDFVENSIPLNPADDPPVVVDVNPSSIEKLIEKAKSALGLDDVDVTVNPGLAYDDDGEAVFSPSISVAGTDVNDFADSTNPEAPEGGEYVPPIVVVDGNFPLYEQCKALLTNLFNYNDVVKPPSFKFYWDSNKDGINEVYDVLDLSFLETSLTNKNMVDKGFWSTPIKVIDVIRYVIAAVIYGLFVMRLIKRLPYFYGGGTWANL